MFIPYVIVLLLNFIDMLRKSILLLFIGLSTMLVRSFTKPKRPQRWFSIRDRSGFLGI